MVITYKKGKDISVMVWAAIWWKDGKAHKSELYIPERDWESKKHGYTARSYKLSKYMDRSNQSTCGD